MGPAPSDPIPRGALVAVAGVLVIAIGGAATARLTRSPAPTTAPPAVASVELRFADRADGAVSVADARSGAPVSVLAPDTNGFVRGVMRGLARDRMSRHIGPAAPFRLSLDHGGHLWLQDTATRRLIDLDAFGSGNRAAFAAFLPAGSTRA